MFYSLVISSFPFQKCLIHVLKSLGVELLKKRVQELRKKCGRGVSEKHIQPRNLPKKHF